MARLTITGNAVDQNKVPVVGAQVYVYADGVLADLENVSGGPLANPLTTMADGFFAAYSTATGPHVLEFHWGGKIRYIEAVSEVARIKALADEAKGAAQAAIAAGGPLYISIAAGLAATTSGDEFTVDTGDGTAAIYLNNDGVAVLRRTIIIDPGSALAPGLIGYGSNQTYADGTVGNELIPRVTRALLKAVSPKNGKVAFLQDAGREGFFRCFPGSPPVTDTFEGLYIVSNTAGFYWARVLSGKEALASWWGVSTANADNGVLINNAVSLHPDVLLPPGPIAVQTTVKLLKNDSVLRGCGQNYVDASSYATGLYTTSATLRVLQVGPDSAPVGGVNAFPRGMRIEDLFVGRTVGPDKTAKPEGVAVQFCIQPEINRVKSVDHTRSFRFRGTVAPRVIGTNANRVLDGTGTGADEWDAYWLDGDVNIGLAGGNASVYFFQTQAGCNNAALQNGLSRGYRLTGKFQDTFFLQPESVTCNVGISIEGGAGSGDADIKITEPVMDQFVKWGIYAANLSANATLTITNPYLAGFASSQFALYVNTCAGQINIEGGEVLGFAGAYATGAAIGIAGSHGVSVRGTMLKDLGGTGVGIAGTCSSLHIATKHHNPNVTAGAAVQVAGTNTASVYEPFVSGKASAFTHGIQVLGTADARNEYRMTGVNSASIAGGAANKLTRNAVQITATGLSGGNDVSGVMA